MDMALLADETSQAIGVVAEVCSDVGNGLSAPNANVDKPVSEKPLVPVPADPHVQGGADPAYDPVQERVERMHRPVFVSLSIVAPIYCPSPREFAASLLLGVLPDRDTRRTGSRRTGMRGAGIPDDATTLRHQGDSVMAWGDVLSASP